MKTSEVLQHYKDGVRNFQGIHIVGSLEGENLEDIEFVECSLLVNFKGANLTGAKFVKGNIRNGNFRDADLTNVRFENVVIDTANFAGAKADSVAFRNNRYAGSYATQDDFDGRIRHN
ncbi:hypothetical protein BH09BAC1_BH09BAC1_28030 [soil metagenome]